MTTPRRQQVLRLYHLALASEPDDRRAFLGEACAGDEELLREVEALLAHDPPDAFLGSSALAVDTGLSSAGPAETLTGQQIGAYRVEARLGSGGMGHVYRATDTVLGRHVAIKVLPPAFAFDPEGRMRLAREAKALAALNHPHIAHVYGLETSGSSAAPPVSALVMELVEGDTLAQILARGPLTIEEGLRYGAQIADALAAAHAHGIVHRDVKPANVMVGESGIKVVDFGLAKQTLTPGVQGAPTERTVSGGEAQTAPQAILGTVAYMSPEQAEGRPVDARSDVFSLGVVLYEIFCGRRPFAGDTAIATVAATLTSPPLRPRAVRKTVPPDLEQVVLRCLEKAPEARFASARELHEALTACLTSRTTGHSTRRAVLVGTALLAVGVVAGLAVRAYVQASRAQWVERDAIPEIGRLINENRRLEALALYRDAERAAPASRALFKLADGVEAPSVSFSTTPSGARIYVSDYVAAAGDDTSGWQLLGESPLVTDRLPRWGYYRIRAVKEGHATVEVANSGGARVDLTLHKQDDVPPGMVWIPSVTPVIPLRPGIPPASLPGFWMDRYEVTNWQFKAFVDAGGYRNERYWTHRFVRNGRTLAWQDAIAEFTDATGRPGPATWQLGTYPDGSEDIPVGGVSWYEAAAYAEFAGKSLPTLYEWFGALSLVANSEIIAFSNFRGSGPERAGANQGMARFGTYDMAGNLKEWAANTVEDGKRSLLGGAWDEDSYVTTAPDARAPFERDTRFGFRLVRRVAQPPDVSVGPLAIALPASSRGASPDDETFQRFLDLHAYDETDLDARVEGTDKSSPHWRRETVTLRAAYGNERVIAHLFLPTTVAPPYQVVAYMGGTGILSRRRVEDLDRSYGFLVRSGRAVLIPAYSGTLERGPSPQFLSVNEERDRAIKWSKDLGRSLDYLGTRADLDLDKLGFYGVSLGGTHGPRLVTVDGRFKAAVLVSAGQADRYAAETNAWSFAPRVRVPVLMLNGRDDFIFPYATSQRPLFEALGTKVKVFRPYDGGHANLVTRPDLIGEVLAWLDRYLGPVAR